MKTLILQVLIGKGNLDWANINQDETLFLENVTMKSVQDYANKMGYDYKLVTTLHTVLEALPAHQYLKGMRFTFEKYLHLNNDHYDRILYLDADILVADDCPELPATTGVGAAPVYQWRIDKYHSDWVGRCILVNAGFLLFTKSISNRFYTYIINELNRNDSDFYTGQFHDEVMLARFIRANEDITYDNFGEMWNDTQISEDDRLPFNKRYMYHLAGHFKEIKFNRICRELRKLDLLKADNLQLKSTMLPNAYTRTRQRITE